MEEPGNELGSVQQDVRTCPSCGNELSGAMEFCPVCVLRKGLSNRVESGESATEGTVKPIPDQPAQRFDHYELVTGEDGNPVELGRGGMGVTYKAFDINLRCPVTLKVISERYLGDESARLCFLRQQIDLRKRVWQTPRNYCGVAPERCLKISTADLSASRCLSNEEISDSIRAIAAINSPSATGGATG